jgi:hypothetical protein
MMPYIWCLALILCTPRMVIGGDQRSGTASDCQLIQRAATIYLRVSKPGVTRREIEQYFKQDGGLQVTAPVRYVYKECNFIKVEITFTSAQSGNSTDDTVDHTSKLYIDFPVMD